jgi:aldehyde:ferredoxin oxidoreductase
MNMFGWTGRTVIIDLESNSVTESRTTKKDAEQFIGGRGLGCRLMADLADPGIEPLSPGNPLIFSTGPLTGTSAPMSGHFSITTKSPLTGTISDSNAGGHLGAEMKFAGVDSLIVLGKAAEPAYIRIEDEDVEILPAGHLWGKSTAETVSILEFQGKVACIGKAGERLVALANIVSGGYPSGRGGHGAVAGSKNLKAVVVKGSNLPEIAEPEAFGKAVEKVNRLLIANPPASKGLANYGTAVFADLLDHMGILPADNFRKKGSHEADKISGEFIMDNYQTEKEPCYACPVGCRRNFENGSSVPDYDSLWAFGPNIGNTDLDTITLLNRMCVDYGMDPISCGSAVAAYMELHSVRPGKEELVALVRDIGEGRSELSAGSYLYMCSKGTPQNSMSVKGLDLPGYDPREMAGMALAYATSNRGGCHLSAFMAAPEIMGKPVALNRLKFDGKAALVQYFQNLAAVIDSLVICPYAAFAIGEVEFASLLSTATGKSYTAEELLRAGERIYNLERMYNIKIGFSRKDDTLPERFFGEDGIDRELFGNTLTDYYHFRGWDETGVPSKEKLQELGIWEEKAGKDSRGR